MSRWYPGGVRKLKGLGGDAAGTDMQPHILPPDVAMPLSLLCSEDLRHLMWCRLRIVLRTMNCRVLGARHLYRQLQAVARFFADSYRGETC